MKHAVSSAVVVLSAVALALAIANHALCFAEGPVQPVPAKAEAAAKPQSSAFVSTTTGGKWSALATWQSQDGTAPARTPMDGDVVTINGVVTVDAATTVGTGTGDAVTISSSAKIGDIKLIAVAPLTVRGSIKSTGQSVIAVQAGAGIELDGAAGITPTIHAADGSSIHLCFYGTAAKRCFLRTRAGSAGKPGRVLPDGKNVPASIGAAYTDFSDLGDTAAWGLTVLPAADALLQSLDHCTFTRTRVWVDAENAEFTLSNSIFKDTPQPAPGDKPFGVSLSGRNLLNVTQCGFDTPVSINKVKNITANVFLRSFSLAIAKKGDGVPFGSWSDNLSRVHNPAEQMLFIPGTYNRSYWINPDPAKSWLMQAMWFDITFDKCIWDIPLSQNVVDVFQGIGVDFRQCLFLPQTVGPRPGSGIVYWGGTRFQHNTIAIPDRWAFVTFLDTPLSVKDTVAEFKNNLCYTPDVVAKPGMIFSFEPLFYDLVSPANCDYNGRYRALYGRYTLSAGTLGVHDVTGGDPKFVDPARNVMTFYRTQPGVTPGDGAKDYDLALDWIYRHPEKMPEMIDWVRAGFAPTNIAYKAASDPDGPTKGWFGAVEGKEPEKK